MNAGTVQIDTSSTQLGEVISGEKITAVPLDGRSYLDLLALQPGVAPTRPACIANRVTFR